MGTVSSSANDGATTKVDVVMTVCNELRQSGKFHWKQISRLMNMLGTEKYGNIPCRNLDWKKLQLQSKNKEVTMINYFVFT